MPLFPWPNEGRLPLLAAAPASLLFAAAALPTPATICPGSWSPPPPPQSLSQEGFARARGGGGRGGTSREARVVEVKMEEVGYKTRHKTLLPKR